MTVARVTTIIMTNPNSPRLSVMPSIPRIARLENGAPHFRYWHRGKGVFDVFVSRAGERDRGDDIFLGRIQTLAPIARGKDPGNWRVLRQDPRPYDSMDDAALDLLSLQARESGDRKVA